MGEYLGVPFWQVRKLNSETEISEMVRNESKATTLELMLAKEETRKSNGIQSEIPKWLTPESSSAVKAC